MRSYGYKGEYFADNISKKFEKRTKELILGKKNRDSYSIEVTVPIWSEWGDSNSRHLEPKCKWDTFSGAIRRF